MDRFGKTLETGEDLNSRHCFARRMTERVLIILTHEQTDYQDPEHFAVRQYKNFKAASGQVSKSVFIHLTFFCPAVLLL